MLRVSRLVSFIKRVIKTQEKVTHKFVCSVRWANGAEINYICGYAHLRGGAFPLVMPNHHKAIQRDAHDVSHSRYTGLGFMRPTLDVQSRSYYS
ncbi:unnamed protein product [Phytomonas sp. Hart1]|nr:unnamed protein product [Phytomonas sp. Hart1]|eukprot:CCW68224.1 unnamed protein product [Phytomonas sp. isolate Hart1]